MGVAKPTREDEADERRRAAVEFIASAGGTLRRDGIWWRPAGRGPGLDSLSAKLVNVLHRLGLIRYGPTPDILWLTAAGRAYVERLKTSTVWTPGAQLDMDL